MKRLLLLPVAFLILGSPASYELRAEPDHKVLICHIPPGNPDNRHEILIDFHAVPAHMVNHGDTLGPCDVTPAPPPQ
jgi:hypothetical protein